MRKDQIGDNFRMPSHTEQGNMEPRGNATVLAYSANNQNGTIVEIDGRKIVYVGSSYSGEWRPLEEFIGGKCTYCNLPLQRSKFRIGRWLCFNKGCPSHQQHSRWWILPWIIAGLALWFVFVAVYS